MRTNNWKAFHNGPAVEKQVRVDKPLFPSYVATQIRPRGLYQCARQCRREFPEAGRD